MRLCIKYIKINKVNFTFFSFRKNYFLIVLLTTTNISPYTKSEKGKEKKKRNPKKDYKLDRQYLRALIIL